MASTLDLLFEHRDRVIDLLKINDGNKTETARQLVKEISGLPSVRTLRRTLSDFLRDHCEAGEIIIHNCNLKAQNQRLQDTNRIERKSQREYYRLHNAVEDICLDIKRLLDEQSEKFAYRIYDEFAKGQNDSVLLVHLSDLHLNEIIDLPTNKFDFYVASKRLRLLANKVKRLATFHNANKIVVAFGGDLINSDRRIDEMLMQATNRSVAMVVAADLLRQFLQDIAEYCYLEIFGITGNEGRAKKELSFSEDAVTDNYDASVYYILSSHLAKDERMFFHPFQGNEVTFQIYDRTFLLIHGHTTRATNQRDVQALFGKWSQYGVHINHLLCGHIHSSMVSDYASRNSSLAGSNAYSSEGLHFCSKAAQNVHIITKHDADAVRVDLQTVDHVEGYQILDNLLSHKMRSVDSSIKPFNVAVVA